MMSNTRTPIEIKAAALADLANGEQPAVIADRYGIPAGTVRQWKNRHDVTPDVTDRVTVVTRPTFDAQQYALGELVQQNLRAKLIATQRIAEHATNPAWLDKQTAADVATLFECLDRSAVGILDRLAQRRADQGGADAESDAG